jgi:hypothetical protein
MLELLPFEGFSANDLTGLNSSKEAGNPFLWWIPHLRAGNSRRNPLPPVDSSFMRW